MTDGSFIIFGLSFVGGIWASRYLHAKWSRNRKKALAPTETPMPEKPVPAMRRRLEIPGTRRTEGPTPALKSWGITAAEVQDVVYVAGPVSRESLPEAVLGCLKMCFNQGTCRGIEVPQFLAGHALKAGQTLYFVLTESKAGAPKLTALIG